MIKRIFDIFVAAVGLLVLLPMLAIVALLIKKEDGGPIFYRSFRAGRYNQPFQIFKFRSMVVNADKLGGASAAESDPRITKTGYLLRKYKIDELPQLFNVLIGHMSLVGPRPEVQHYVDMFTTEEEKILSVRPGITDWATLWNADQGATLEGCEDPDAVYLEKIRPHKLKLQLKYVNEQSFWVDIKILIATLVSLISRKRLNLTPENHL